MSRDPAAPGRTPQAARAADAEAPLPLVEQIEREIRAGQVELPVLPETALRVRELIRGDAQVSEIVSVIEREPPLAAALLRYANSIAFAGMDEVTDLRHAVTRLGMTAAEQTVLGISAKNVFASRDPEDQALLRRLWEHSLAVAVGARGLAVLTKAATPETAFLGGLLHDIGKVVILRTVARIKKNDPARRLSEATLFALFDTLHCELGEHLFESWNLPAVIREIVRHHHDSDLDPETQRPVLTVVLADQLAAQLGLALRPEDSTPLHASAAAIKLGLGESQLDQLRAEVETDLRSAQSVF